MTDWGDLFTLLAKQDREQPFMLDVKATGALSSPVSFFLGKEKFLEQLLGKEVTVSLNAHKVGQRALEKLVGTIEASSEVFSHKASFEVYNHITFRDITFSYNTKKSIDLTEIFDTIPKITLSPISLRIHAPIARVNKNFESLQRDLQVEATIEMKRTTSITSASLGEYEIPKMELFLSKKYDKNLCISSTVNVAFGKNPYHLEKLIGPTLEAVIYSSCHVF